MSEIDWDARFRELDNLSAVDLDVASLREEDTYTQVSIERSETEVVISVHTTVELFNSIENSVSTSNPNMHPGRVTEIVTGAIINFIAQKLGVKEVRS